MHLVSDPRIGMFFFLVGFQCSIVPLLLDDEHPNLPQKKKKLCCFSLIIALHGYLKLHHKLKLYK